MKTHEYNHGNNWIDKLLNSYPFLLDSESIVPLLRFGLCRTDGLWHFWFARNAGESLFYNGAFFMRFMFPFWIGIHIRFTSTRFLQCGIGWKLNGRLGALFRIQSDESATAGAHDNAPNHGHTNGWECGNK